MEETIFIQNIFHVINLFELYKVYKKEKNSFVFCIDYLFEFLTKSLCRLSIWIYRTHLRIRCLMIFIVFSDICFLHLKLIASSNSLPLNITILDELLFETCRNVVVF